MAVRIRKSVWSLPQGDPILTWYRKAVAELLKRPSTNPSSWRYLASIHGVPPSTSIPSAANGFWDQCQHQTWFFLPWHRGYIASFEAVVAKTIVELGGPADWALPYWNYSERLTANPKARLMPPDFFKRTLPDGSANALWSKRAAVANGDFGLGNSVVTLAALQRQNFASQPNTTGFGGPVTGFHTGGGNSGALENLPHNRVHTQIGGDTGFMSDPATAALDPIFWLHHCNIDRLWEVWRNQGAAFRNPTDPQWLTAVPFNMHDGSGQPFTYNSRDMLDTTRVMHGYRYDSVPVAQPAPVPVHETLEVAMAERGAPELAGASEGPVPLTGDVTTTVVKLRRQLTTRSFLESTMPTPQHVYLSLENITGSGVPGDYKVYLDMPDDNKDPVLAGVLTTFGLERASDSTRSHGGSGLGHVFDITELAGPLGLTKGTVDRLQVSFVRERAAPSEEGAPEGLGNYVQAAKPEPAIKVGRVNLFYD